MIRINLLPREEKSQRKASGAGIKVNDLVLPLGGARGLRLIVAGTAMSQRTRRGQLEKSIRRGGEQSRALAPQIERVNRLAPGTRELDLRLASSTDSRRDGPRSVRLMDELARVSARTISG